MFTPMLEPISKSEAKYARYFILIWFDIMLFHVSDLLPFVISICSERIIRYDEHIIISNQRLLCAKVMFKFLFR